MYTTNSGQTLQVTERMNTYTSLPLALVIQPDIKLYELLADLSPDTPWGDRQNAANELGNMSSPEALKGLLDALPTDPFWMVRCTIIQALEKIGDVAAIPTLQEVVESDSFQVVQSYATKAIQRLSQEA